MLWPAWFAARQPPASFRRRRHPVSPASFKPSLELLEDRCLAVMVTGTGSAAAAARPAGKPVAAQAPAANQGMRRDGKVAYRPLVYAPGLVAHVFLPPRSDDPVGRSPAVAFFHGGGLVAGDARFWFRAARDFAARGFVAISFQYRLGGPAGAAHAVADARSALRWMHKFSARLGIDPERVVAAGDSAGGYLALMTALGDDQPDELYRDAAGRPNAVVAFYPVLDGRLFGLPDALSPLQLARSRPLPPTLVLEGTRDDNPVTPYLVAASFCAGKPNRKLVTLPGSRHNFMWGGKDFPRGLSAMETYLDALGFTAGPRDLPPARGGPVPRSSRR
jgi:acetyl esterase/lipase